MDEPLESLNIRGLCVALGCAEPLFIERRRSKLSGRIVRAAVKLSGTRDRVAWRMIVTGIDLGPVFFSVVKTE